MGFFPRAWAICVRSKMQKFRKRRGEVKEFDPAKKLRYNERSAAERVNSNLKDNYGGDNVRVQGHKKDF